MPSTFINKLFSLYTKIKHPGVPPELRYFYRDTYSSKLAQVKYLVKDYLYKEKYKDIRFNGEFGPELQFVLPFAYWHYKNGTLRSTVSSKFTREFYFFSENHSENFDNRTNEGNYNFEVPRILYSQDYNMSKWLAVPLKEKYKNDVYVFEKPLLIIANRYNMEWNGPPISYFDIPTLDYIVGNLKNHFTIVYNRPRPENITEDNSETYDLNEFNWLKETHPEVLFMQDLYEQNKGNANNFNHLQLMVYANANHFVSIHGGTSVLASYFEGINVILSKQGPEHHFNCYNTLYPKLSGATILHAKNNEEVRHYISENFLPKK
ncbi:hypothetical protein GCM10011387_25990 [Pedobacter quisquiliarum]|jgi:hypothetical protein|uniref:Uncharacterized protein n=1 Tax=Pedobacter quisquiliarum TaxID=1834438 RepID=A0A916XGC1_9SPHI|nr:hypothetical protein [Pedobacter quisquiliarum]GGC71300.1 hypothetical protein GCM10011387_25990 [Pedobacter quisquiliarum]